jgi:uncharacterized protein (TIGR00290 family)
MKKKAIFNWSSGKDSALTLYKTQQNPDIEIVSLITSVNKHYNRISMHGVRVELLEKQTESIGLPLYKIEIPEMPTMTVYEEIMNETLHYFKGKKVTHSIFGDIFLEDLRKYREDKFAEIGIEGVFPLWKIDTNALIKEFLDLGFKTIVTCINERYLNKSSYVKQLKLLTTFKKSDM